VDPQDLPASVKPPANGIPPLKLPHCPLNLSRLNPCQATHKGSPVKSHYTCKAIKGDPTKNSRQIPVK
jgi:hypothetical protein